MIQNDELMNVTPPTVFRFSLASVLAGGIILAEMVLFQHIELHAYHKGTGSSFVYFLFQYLVYPLHICAVIVLLRRKLGHDATEILFPVLGLIGLVLVLLEICARHAPIAPARTLILSLLVAGSQVAAGSFLRERYGPPDNPLPRVPLTQEVIIVGATLGLVVSLFIPLEILGGW